MRLLMYTTAMVRVVWPKLISFDLQPQIHKNYNGVFVFYLLGRTGGVVELVLGSVFIIELDTGLAGIYFHRYYTEYDVCHKQNT